MHEAQPRFFLCGRDVTRQVLDNRSSLQAFNTSEAYVPKAGVQIPGILKEIFVKEGGVFSAEDLFSVIEAEDGEEADSPRPSCRKVN